MSALLLTGAMKHFREQRSFAFTVFLAGHVDALRRAYGPAGSHAQRKAHTLSFPFQLPLVLWAWSLRASDARPRP